MYCLKFMRINEENDPSFQEYSVIKWKYKISIDLQKFKCYGLLFEVCVKTKRFDFFAGNNEIQISNF